ncbi:hypothetical protein ACOMHN_006228 [Nucella lapillus]
MTLTYKPKIISSRDLIVITNNPANPPLRHWLKEQHKVLHSSTKMQKAVPHLPVVGFWMESPGVEKARTRKNYPVRSVVLTWPEGSGLAAGGPGSTVSDQQLCEGKVMPQMAVPCPSLASEGGALS